MIDALENRNGNAPPPEPVDIVEPHVEGFTTSDGSKLETSFDLRK